MNVAVAGNWWSPVAVAHTIKSMSWIVSLIANQKIEDAQCGFKMLSSAFLKRARLISNKFEIEDELLLEASRLGFAIVSVPITSAYGTEHSHIHPVIDTLRFFRFLLTQILKRS